MTEVAGVRTPVGPRLKVCKSIAYFLFFSMTSSKWPCLRLQSSVSSVLTEFCGTLNTKSEKSIQGTRFPVVWSITCSELKAPVFDNNTAADAIYAIIEVPHRCCKEL